jgi:hypothetical protein
MHVSFCGIAERGGIVLTIGTGQRYGRHKPPLSGKLRASFQREIFDGQGKCAGGLQLSGSDPYAAAVLG